MSETDQNADAQAATGGTQDQQATANAQTTNGGQQAANGGGEDDTRQTFDRAYVETLRRENASRRAREKELETKVNEFEEATKSEKEKLESRATKAETDATTSNAKADRYEAAAKAGLDLKYAPRIQGSTPEEMEADAKELAKDFGGRPASDGAAGDAGRRGGNGGSNGANGSSAMNDAIRRKAGVNPAGS